MKLDRAIADYIQLKRTLGFRFCAQSHTLRSFGRSMGRVSLRQVRPRKVQAFLAGTGAVTRSWPQRWSTLNGFYRFAITRGLIKHSPLPLHPPKVINTFRPHIYTVEELRRLLGVITSSRTRSLSPVTMRTLLLLLYGAGLRISEALNLEDGDVDLSASVLQVRRSKFFKTRLVPIGPRLTKILAGYQRKRSAVRGSHRRFFRTKTGARVDCSLVGRVFRDLRRVAQLEQPDRRDQPRLHDLRHSMATHRLLSWYREGADVQNLLPQLSAYLGHAEIADTQIYLTMTAELRDQAGARFARYVWGNPS